MSGNNYTATGYGSYSQQPQASGYGSYQTSGYASQPALGYGSQPASGYDPQPAPGYGSHSPSGYGPQTSAGYGSHSSSGYASQLASGYGSQPASGYASQPAAQYASQPASGYESYSQQQQHSYGQQHQSQQANSNQHTQRHHPYQRAEQLHPYQEPKQHRELKQPRQQSQHIRFDEPSLQSLTQQPCCQWVFTLALKVPEDSYAKLFGGSHEPERYVPPSRDARWSREATKAMEAAPLHPRAYGEGFKVVCDRQQRAIVIASHDKLPDSEMPLPGFQEMLMTLCDTLSHTITGPPGAGASTGQPIYRQQQTHQHQQPPPQQQQQQQGSNSVCIRYNKGTWLRSFKMHLKADVPVSGYLSLLQQRYHNIPPLDPTEAAAMEARAKSDTKGFRHLLNNTSFCPSVGHPCRGGVHLTVSKLVQAGFFCLLGEQQPAGCTGQWWGCSQDSMLVFMPPPTAEQQGQGSGEQQQRVGLCSATQVFEEVARFTERYMAPAAEGNQEGAATGRGGAGGRMPGFCVCVVPSLQAQ